MITTEVDHEEEARKVAAQHLKQRQLREKNLRLQKDEVHGVKKIVKKRKSSVKNNNNNVSSGERFCGGIVLIHKNSGIDSIHVKLLKIEAVTGSTEKHDVHGISNTGDDVIDSGKLNASGEKEIMTYSKTHDTQSSPTYLPFEEARMFARGLKLLECNLKGWLDYCANSKLPANIPREPNLIYAHSGWTTMQDWLGSNLNERHKTVQKSVIDSEVIERRKMNEQVKWDTKIMSHVAIFINSEDVKINNCEVQGGYVQSCSFAITF